MNAASFFLDALPPALAHALLPGGERRDELLAAGALAARLAGEGGAPELAELARELRLAAFETEPLDGVLAAAVTSDFAGFPGSAGSADSADPAGTAVFSAAYAKAARTLAQAVAGRFTPPGEDRYLARLLSKDEPGKLAAYAMDKAAKALGSLSLLPAKPTAPTGVVPPNPPTREGQAALNAVPEPKAGAPSPTPPSAD